MSFINKLKSAFGKEQSQIKDTTEAIINDIDNDAFAVAESNVLYAGLNELGGYFFFQTVIVGTFRIKTKKGIQLKIIGHDFELVLNSDMLELESDHSNISNRNISKIDFQIEEKDAAKIDRSSIKQLVLSTKKGDILFSIFELSDEEE